MSRKRKSEPSEPAAADASSAAKKSCMNGAVAAAGPSSHEAADEECVDSKESLRNSTLIVRLPTQTPNAPSSNVIVIDDSDEEADTVTNDVKPDRWRLDEQLAVPAAADSADVADTKPPLTALINHVENQPVASTSGSSESHNLNGQPARENVVASSTSTAANAHGAIDCVPPVMSSPDNGSTSSQSSSSQRRASKTRMKSPEAVGRSVGKKTVAVQTEFVKCNATMQTGAVTERAEQRLESLRSNVLQLLKSIVPTLSCSNLEFVDELVVEMVRVNAETSEADN